MSKIRDFFAKVTSTKKSNIIFMGVEILLVLAIAGGSIAGVAIAAHNASLSNVSSEEAPSVSEVSEISSVESLPEESSTEALDSMIEETPSVATTPAPQYETVKTTVPAIQGALTQWPEDEFLPTLPEPASIMDYYVTSKLSGEELLMFTSLKGIVNKVQPRIYSCDSEPDVMYDSWVEQLDLKFNKVESPYSLIDKYKRELAGMVVYDDTSKMTDSTINLATTIAGTRSMLVVSPALYDVLRKVDQYKKLLKDGTWKVIDLRKEHFTDKWMIYDYMYENYLDGTSDRVICGLSPTINGYLRDYAIAVGANVIYLDPEANMDAEILTKYLDRMVPGKSVFMGWWTQENDGVNFASSFGIVTLASDFSNNLSVYAGMNKKYPVKKQKTFKAPKLENKIYVAFSISDGDNLQYCENYMYGLWNQPERGDIPLSWTLTPSLADIGKPILSYYNKTKTDNDCFICGPSAWGYFYPKYWAGAQQVREEIKETFAPFLRLSDKYLKKLGWRSISVWNWNSGAMERDMMKVYANNMPSLLGISQQENMPKPIYRLNDDFLVIQLDGSYCGELYQMEQILTNKINDFYAANAKKPLFVTICGVPWEVGGNLSNFVDVAERARDQAGDDISFIRMDQMYQLMTKYEKSK